MAIPRQQMPQRDGQERSRDFKEVNLGLAEQVAIREAHRCLQCKTPKCVEGCPVGIDIPGFAKLVAEGNFLAAAAVHEMLLQSWSPQPGTGHWGAIRIFPATPWRWHEASFEDLRAEGGHKVSAKRADNATTWFRVTAGRDGIIKIRDNFGGRVPEWGGKGVEKKGSDFEILMKKGESVEATLPKPTGLPAAPPNAVESRR